MADFLLTSKSHTLSYSSSKNPVLIMAHDEDWVLGGRVAMVRAVHHVLDTTPIHHDHVLDTQELDTPS